MFLYTIFIIINVELCIYFSLRFSSNNTNVYGLLDGLSTITNLAEPSKKDDTSEFDKLMNNYPTDNYDLMVANILSLVITIFVIVIYGGKFNYNIVI